MGPVVGQFPYRPVRRVVTRMTYRRGNLRVDINAALNKPTTKFGVDYRFLGACFVVAIVVFLFGSKLFACLILPSLVAAGALLTKRDPQMFRLWLLSFKLRPYCDPGK